MYTLLAIFKNSFFQFFALFGVFIAGGFILTLISRWTNNVFRQFLFPDFGMYAFGFIGVPAHELCHALFCKLFLHDVKKIKWFDPSAKGGAYGAVTHQYSQWNLYHRVGHFFIGLGPAILGPVFLAILLFLLVPGGKTILSVHPIGVETLAPSTVAVLQSLYHLFTSHRVLSSPWFYVFLYLAISIASQIELSTEDIKQAAQGILPLSFVLLCVNVIAWALNSQSYWHTKVVHVGMVIMTFAGSIFVLATVLSLLFLIVMTLLFSLINLISGRESINPFRQ